jgi:DNA-binding NarL/FixJ family response regulator
MVTSGRQIPGRDEAIAALFHACYPQLVATGYGVAGDWAVAALSPRKRACVVLRYLAGMTEAQTAQTLGITPGTVKSQTHKALRQLRQQLSEPAAGAGQTHAAETEGR